MHTGSRSTTRARRPARRTRSVDAFLSRTQGTIWCLLPPTPLPKRGIPFHCRQEEGLRLLAASALGFSGSVVGCYDRSLASSLLRLGDGPHLAHRAQEVVLGPLLNQLATLVKAVDVDACELYPIASAGDAEELPLVGAADRVAGYHLITLSYLVFNGVGKVGDGLAEVLDLALDGLRSPDLTRFTVGVVADEIRVEHLVYQFRLALAEALLQKTLHCSLVLFRHRDLLSLLLLPVLRPYPWHGELKRSGRTTRSEGANFRECGFRNCPKRGMSNAPTVNLAGIRRGRWTEKLFFGGRQGYVAGASETFRTVSPGTWVNRGLASLPARPSGVYRGATIVRRERAA